MFAKLRLGVLAATVATILVTTVGGPAAAGATYVNRIVPGAYGKLYDIKWSSTSTSYVSFMFLVQDTDADGDHAEARVQSMTPNGTITSYRWHSAVGYGDENRFSTYINSSSSIAAIRIQVCRRGDDLPDVCGTSSWAYQF